MFVIWRNNPPFMNSDTFPANFARLAGKMTVYISHYDIEITVPKGFMTDGASVPIIANRIVKRWGKHKYCDTVHDYLYGTKEFSRSKSDFIYGMMLWECKGISKTKAIAMFLAVRIFGGRWYGKTSDT